MAVSAGSDSFEPREAALSKSILGAGFLLLAAAVWIAHLRPARGFELSIYDGTPAAFWVAIGASTLLALAVAFAPSSTGRTRKVAAALGGGSVAAVAALPLLRGYHFYGPADSLTHLGWTKDLATGSLSPYEFLYPGVHTSSLLLARLSGHEFGYALQVIVLACLLAFLLFVPLCVDALTGSRLAIPIGAFSAALLLPINNISSFNMAHPTTQAILLAPLVVYLLFRHLTTSPRRGGWRSLATPASALLLVAGVSVVFFHPQQSLNVLAVLGAVAGVQLVSALRSRAGAIDDHAGVYVHVAAIGALAAYWIPRHDRTERAAEGVREGLMSVFEGESQAGSGVSSRSGSLEQIGGGVEELFVKLFLVDALFCLLAGGLLVAVALDRWRGPPRDDRGAFLWYLTVAFGGLAVGFVVYFLSGVTTQHYRQVGFLMVVVTLLGAVAIARLESAAVSWPSRRRAVTLVAVSLAVLLLVSSMSLHRSPFMYQPSDHVSQMQLEGYETAFEHHDPEVRFLGIRSGPGRYGQAVYGSEAIFDGEVLAGDGHVEPAVFEAGNFTEHYGEPSYVVSTARDYEREVHVFRELRYSAAGFERLDREPGVDRVSANGEVDVYYVDG